VWPIGGHAVYIDARAMLPRIPPRNIPVKPWPSHSTRPRSAYLRDRTAMFGRQPTARATGGPRPRTAGDPRRTYTQSHIDYVIEACRHVAEHADQLTGYRMVEDPPTPAALHRQVRAAGLKVLGPGPVPPRLSCVLTCTQLKAPEVVRLTKALEALVPSVRGPVS